MKALFIFILCFSFLASALIATPIFAQQANSNNPTPTCEAKTGEGITRLETDTILKDPGCAYQALGSLIGLLFDLALLAGALVAILFMVIGAYQWITAGTGDGAKKGRSTILYAAIGLIGLALVYVFMLFYNNLTPK